MKSIFVILSVAIVFILSVHGKGKDMKELQELLRNCQKELNISSSDNIRKELAPKGELSENGIKVLDCIGTKFGMIADKKIDEAKFASFLMLIPKSKPKSDEIVKKCLPEYKGDDNLKAMETLMKCIKTTINS